MLFVFHVDTGTTITFDIETSLKRSVSELKEAIERECGVSPNNQVLLMSGGESLESSARVGSYMAGTDTNPIYLFSRANIESQQPPVPNTDYGIDVDLKSQVDASLQLPPSYPTLSARANLASQFCALARDQVRICERLVHDQHLQQQGWAAVLANLEDVTQTLQARAELFQNTVMQYLPERDQYRVLLDHFHEDLKTLDKIPILPALHDIALGFVSPSDQQELNAQQQQQSQSQETAQVQDAENEGTVATIGERSASMSLFGWITSADKRVLEQLEDQCSRILEQFDESFLEGFKNDVQSIIDSAKKTDLIEIKGLGDRLFALEQLMAQTKKFERAQSELSQGFQQNKTRVTHLNDNSVLPDLCVSHCQQLTVMLQNHNHLRDIRRRCTKAKEELSFSIHKRLKWIMYVENRIMEMHSKLTMYSGSLQRLRRQIGVIRQIHEAPQMYVNAIAEVVRRRTFSQAFLSWANNVACQMLSLHNEEIGRRREFKSKFEGHFLTNLFPGLEDIPPAFCTQAPNSFDNGLPQLTPEDVESLKQQLPEVAESVCSPDMSSVTQFFLSKSSSISGSTSNKEKDSIPIDSPPKDQESSSMCIDSTPKEQESSKPPTSDRAGFESETDTEEFEKISHATMDSKIESVKQDYVVRQKQLEENLNQTRQELEKVNAIFGTVKVLANSAVNGMRSEIQELKDQVQENSMTAKQLVGELQGALRTYMNALTWREQELTVDHELEMSDMKQMMKELNSEMQTANDNLMDAQSELQDKALLIMNLQKRLEEKDNEIENARFICRQIDDKHKFSLHESEATIKALKEENEKLQMEYKANLEAIRSRYKLMSTMERSPSDSSLEKIERVDVIELINHETILSQVKKDMEAQKEEAVRTAVEQERASLTQELQMAKEIINKHEHELQVFRQREETILNENMLLKTSVQRLSETGVMIESLKEDKQVLQHKAAVEKQKLEDLDRYVVMLKREREELRRELNEERLKMNQSNVQLSESMATMADSEKDEVRVSESKKVRLETDGSLGFSGRVEALEADNKRLNSELRAIRESKERIEAKVETLEYERSKLEGELERAKRNLSSECLNSSSIATGSETNRAKDMNASVSVVSEATSSRVDAATSTERTRRENSSAQSVREKLSKSTSNVSHLSKIHKVNFSSCNPGDTVLVLWDLEHNNYSLLQDSQTYYFLNSDCLADLDLKIGADGQPSKLYVIAEVVEKEYCSARKAENRYRVPLGTKFYRVRVKPCQRHASTSTNQ